MATVRPWPVSPLTLYAFWKSAGVNEPTSGLEPWMTLPSEPARAIAKQASWPGLVASGQTRTAVVGACASWPGIAVAPARPAIELRPSAPAASPAARNDRFTQNSFDKDQAATRRRTRGTRQDGTVPALSRRYQQRPALNRSTSVRGALPERTDRRVGVLGAEHRGAGDEHVRACGGRPLD